MSARRVSPVLVGREAEADVLEDAFEAAAAGAPHVVLLGAEAGGGKSRLVTEFATQVRGRAVVLTGGCVDIGAPQPAGCARSGPGSRAGDSGCTGWRTGWAPWR
ncbi:MAG: ATP-binding protein [Streptosporangiaceae bacterium]